MIVIGAGGGGAVAGKKLAGRGLDVLVLEAGPRWDRPREQGSHLENDANNPLSGYFRFGPGDRSKPAWYRETPQNSFLWQLSGVGRTTQHCYGNCPRAYPGVFAGYAGRDARAYDRLLFPFPYSELVPYYRWVRRRHPAAGWQRRAHHRPLPARLPAGHRLGRPGWARRRLWCRSTTG